MNEIICKHVCLPSLLPPWSSRSFLIWSSCFHLANLQTCLWCNSKNCLVKPKSEHITPVFKTSNHFRGKSWGLGATWPFLFFLQPLLFYSLFSCAPSTLASCCCLSISSVYEDLNATFWVGDPRPSYPSSNSLLSLPLFLLLPDIF